MSPTAKPVGLLAVATVTGAAKPATVDPGAVVFKSTDPVPPL